MMIENIRWLPGISNIVSPAAYRAGAKAGVDSPNSPGQQSSVDGSSSVKVTLSEEALAMIRGTSNQENLVKKDTGETESEGSNLSGDETQLSEEEQRQVEKLKARDKQVRSHEQAHLAAAGGLATSGAKYEYETGPDGQRYAVGGEVNISYSESDDPQETIRSAEQAARAALAPADPSPQDRRVAADASSKASQARQELSQQQININQEGENQSFKANQAVKSIVGRLELRKQSFLERGVMLGIPFSSLSIQA